MIVETTLTTLALLFIAICISITIPFIVLILWHDHKKRQETVKRIKDRGAKHVCLDEKGHHEHTLPRS